MELKLGKAAATLGGEVSQHLSGSQAYHPWRAIWQETNGGWEVESGSPFTTPESASVSGGPVSFSVTIAGSPISFSCGETSANAATLEPGGTESISGLTFSGCAFEAPTTCSLPGNQMQLQPITGVLSRVDGKVYEKFTANNAEGAFMWMQFEGASCPWAGTVYRVAGSFAGLGSQLGLFNATQPLEFSKAANEATGSQMTVGNNHVAMYMAGSLSHELSSGTPWGAF